MAGEHRPNRRIPLRVFRRMLHSVSAAELRRLPPEAFPKEIPLEVIDEAPPELRGVLEEFCFDLSCSELSSWRADAENWGRDVAAAIELAGRKDPRTHADELREAMEALAVEWKSATSGTIPDVLTRFAECRSRYEAVQGELARLLPAIQSVSNALGTDGPNERLSETHRALQGHVRAVERALARYHSIHLQVLHREMRDTRDEIDAVAFEDARLREKLDALHERLERSHSLLRRTLRPEATRRERERLEQRIGELSRERGERESILAEQDMTRWLDGVVEASLYLPAAGGEQALRAARLQLFQLLNLFCRQQEEAAQQVARNPLLQLDPEQTIDFLLTSERFILGYFARKKNDVTRWLGGAAEQRLHELEDVERDILGEFRRHRRRH